MRSKEVPLKIEVFANDEENDFIIHDPREIASVLRDIATHRSRVALYFNDANSMVLTLLLAVDETGVWVDAAANPLDNRHIERSSRIVFVSTHNQAKVQWVSTETSQCIFENSAAFFLPLPRKLLRLQRRDFYRLMTREPEALKCLIRPTPGQAHLRHEVTVMDISIGGVALVCKEDTVDLQPGMTYENCEIDLPDIGTINATIEVKNTFEVTARNGNISRRAGCVFVKPNGETSRLLQRYVALKQQQIASLKR
ncbi:MAG: YcgR family protein [Gallionellaceae bacterium]|nr:MAG: YcgR family protein [Gallionellaceae bacterium]